MPVIVDLGTARTEFKRLLNRNDCTDTDADGFIRLGLARLGRTLRVPTMERLVLLTVAEDGTVQVPRDYMSLIGLWAVGSRVPMDKKNYADLRLMAEDGSMPTAYTRIGDKWHMRPRLAEGATVECYYYADFRTLAVDTDSDPILLIAPDCILYAALKYAANRYIDSRLQSFEDQYLTSKSELEAQMILGEFSEGPLVMSGPYAEN